MTSFAFQPLFELGHDDATPYRKLDGDLVGTANFGGRRVLTVDAEALTRLAAQAVRDVSHLFRPGHLAQLRKILDDPEASTNDRFVALNMLQERQRRRRAWSCRRARTPAPRSSSARRASTSWTSGDDEEALARGIFDDLHADEPALLADGAAHDVRGDEHRHQPAGADRALRDRRRRVPLPLRHQGRRLGEQVVPLPGDRGAPESARRC